MRSQATLYLLPVPISDDEGLNNLPQANAELVRGLVYFIAEDERNARRFLKLCAHPNISGAQILLLNEHSLPEDVPGLLAPLLAGNSVGLMSDAGCPGIADPGAAVVAMAHSKSIKVVPLTGPSSIVLAIMASGFNGQNFAFTGYLPVDAGTRARRIRELESLSLKQRQAQFFIETPYRNRQLLEALVKTLQPATRLFTGVELGSSRQLVLCKTVAEWKRDSLPELHKKPVVFGIYA